MTTGLCVLCNVEVTEEDHRREIDCPSKSCPGRVYHEDCISAYLKRTKYSKDRCTGFPCPAILSTGKPCPGYVCKMHNYFPANQKKKQARVQAALAAQAATVAAAKLKPVPNKAKAGAQVAIAAIKGSAPPGGAVSAVQRLPKPVTSMNVSRQPPIANTSIIGVQHPRIIPGFDGPSQGLSREDLRARIAAARAEAKAGHGGKGGGGSDPVGWAPAQANGVFKTVKGFKAKPNNNDNDDEERMPRPTMLWDAIAMQPALGGELNYYDLERYNQNGGGHFTARLKNRLEGKNTSPVPDEPLFHEFVTSECGSFGGSSTSSYQDNRNEEGFGKHPGFQREHSGPPTADDFPELPKMPSSTPVSDAILNYAHQQACVGESIQPPQAAVPTANAPNNMLDTGRQSTNNISDRVLEYDMVFASEDGLSYLIFDTISNMYVGLEELYGPAPELIECLAEDSNMYLCVAVRSEQQERRMRWQEAWVQSKFADTQPDTAQAQEPQSPATDSMATATDIKALFVQTTEIFKDIGQVFSTSDFIVSSNLPKATASMNSEFNTFDNAANKMIAMHANNVNLTNELVPGMATATPQDNALSTVLFQGGINVSGCAEVATEDNEDDTDITSLMELLCV